MGFEDYLIANVNELHNLTIQAQLYPAQEGTKIHQAALIGCDTLKRLVDDRSFARTVEELSEARFAKLEYQADGFRRHDSDEFRQLINREDSFEAFLHIEYNIMVKAGLFPDIAGQLIRESRLALQNVKDRAVPPAEVIGAVMRLRDQACLMANDLTQEAVHDRKWEKWKDRIKRMVKGIGGAALVGVNAVTFASTAATPAALATGAMGAVSGAVGIDIVKNAAMPKTTGKTMGQTA